MKNWICTLIVLLTTSLTINAQNAKEAIQNTKQIIDGKRNLERDMAELKDFRAKLGKLKSAVAQEDEEAVNRLKADLVADMTREVSQSGEKAKQARREIAQSSAEVRSERREIRDNREDSKRGRYDRRDDRRDMARDQANKRDDQRDRRDDVRDFSQQIERAEKQAKLLETIKDLDFSLQYRSVEGFAERKRTTKGYFNDFIKLMKDDIAATKIELAEDNRERREDRRERADDRQERDEKDDKKRRRRIRN